MTSAGQASLFDTSMYFEWVNANAAGDTALAEYYAARLRPEFRPAFDAWVATEPRTNPDAPSGPFAMAEYVLADQVKANELEAKAAALFEEGKAAIQ
jgi:hypothetical protein